MQRIKKRTSDRKAIVIFNEASKLLCNVVFVNWKKVFNTPPLKLHFTYLRLLYSQKLHILFMN